MLMAVQLFSLLQIAIRVRLFCTLAAARDLTRLCLLESISHPVILMLMLKWGKCWPWTAHFCCTTELSTGTTTGDADYQDIVLGGLLWMYT